MAALELCTATDVIRRSGGTVAVIQLIPDGTDPSTYDTALMTLAIQDASNIVAMAAGVQSVLSGYTQAQYQDKFPELVTLAAQKAPYFLWLYGSKAQACPELVQALNASVEADLQRLRERKNKHGAVDFSPTPAHRIAQVDMDPNDTRSLGDLSAWTRGFH